MNIDIDDEDLRELVFKGSNRGKYRRLSRDRKFVGRLIDVYNLMKSVSRTSDLGLYSFLHYEKLRHIPLSSVRIMNSRVERLLFRELTNGLEIVLIEINDDHYGNGK